MRKLILLLIAGLLLLFACSKTNQLQIDSNSFSDDNMTSNNTPITSNNNPITCNDNMIFCKNTSEWICPESNEHFAFCRGGNIAAEVCEKEVWYIQWLYDNCPGVEILE